MKFTYVPFKGGGEVCVNLVGKHVDSTVNNPDRVRQPLEGRAGAPARVSSTPRGSPTVPDWKDHPTVEGSGGRGHPAT